MQTVIWSGDLHTNPQAGLATTSFKLRKSMQNCCLAEAVGLYTLRLLVLEFQSAVFASHISYTN